MCINLRTAIAVGGEGMAATTWFTVASPFFHEQEAKAGNIKRIRWGEVAATLIVMMTGAAVAYQQRDAFPLIASGLISTVFIAGYEYQIRHPATEDQGGQQRKNDDHGKLTGGGSIRGRGCESSGCRPPNPLPCQHNYGVDQR